MIPITGKVEDRASPTGSITVSGFAFQVPGFEFLHTWATRSLSKRFFDEWIVTHWESGKSIGESLGVLAATPEEAAEKCAKFLRRKGVKRVKAVLAKAGYDGAAL